MRILIDECLPKQLKTWLDGEHYGIQTMNNQLALSDPEILGGTPVFIGTRVPVAVLFENLADDLSLDEILDSYPTLKLQQMIDALYQAGTLLERPTAA